jgi:hypothetical protein
MRSFRPALIALGFHSIPSVAGEHETTVEVIECFIMWGGAGARGVALRGSNSAAPTIKEARFRETGRRVFAFSDLRSLAHAFVRRGTPDEMLRQFKPVIAATFEVGPRHVGYAQWTADTRLPFIIDIDNVEVSVWARGGAYGESRATARSRLFSAKTTHRAQ